MKFKNQPKKNSVLYQKKTATQLAKRIKDLSNNPRPSGCIKLKGNNELWRIRSGNHRLIYSIKDEILTIEILEVIDRKDAY